jgi:hypothetical protein
MSNILNRKEVVKEIPPYFKNQSVPIVSYSYTKSIGRKIVNYKEALQDINISKRNMEEFSVVIMKRFRSNWLEKTKGHHVTYNTRQFVLRRKRIYASLRY